MHCHWRYLEKYGFKPSEQTLLIQWVSSGLTLLITMFAITLITMLIATLSETLSALKLKTLSFNRY